METERLVQAFLDHSLPKSGWTHHAHLRVGIWHVLRHGTDQALDLLRSRIRAYNEATGVANTPSGGYHETITRFYILVIDGFLRTSDVSRPIDELAQELIARHGDKELPLRFYSRELLFSPYARAHWVDPDLSPIAA